MKKKKSSSSNRSRTSSSKAAGDISAEEVVVVPMNDNSNPPGSGLVESRRKSLFSIGVNNNTRFHHTRRAAAPRKRQSRRTKSMDTTTPMDDSSMDASARLSFEVAIKANQEEADMNWKAAAAAAEQQEQAQDERVQAVASRMRQSRRRASMEKRSSSTKSASTTTTMRAATGKIRGSTGQLPTELAELEQNKGLVARRRQTLFNVDVTRSGSSSGGSRRRGSRRGSSSPGSGSFSSDGSKTGRRTRRGRRASQMVISRQQEITRQLNTSNHAPATEEGKRRPTTEADYHHHAGGEEDHSNNNNLAILANKGDGTGKAASLRSKRRKSGMIPTMQEAAAASAARDNIDDSVNSDAPPPERRLSNSSIGGLSMSSSSQDFTTGSSGKVSFADSSIGTSTQGGGAMRLSSQEFRSSTGSKISFTGESITEEEGEEGPPPPPTASERPSLTMQDASSRKRAFRRRMTAAANLFKTDAEEENALLMPDEAEEAIQRPNKKRISLEEQKQRGLVTSRKKDLHQRITTSVSNTMSGFQSKVTSNLFQPLANKTKAMQSMMSSTLKSSPNNKNTTEKPRKKWTMPKWKGKDKSLSSTKKSSKSSTPPANTKRPLSKERAALRIQKFMKESTSILSWYRTELTFWMEEGIDIERRRKEELQEVQMWMELEKQTFQLQLLYELQGQSSMPSDIEDLKQQVLNEKVEHQRLQNDIQQMNQNNQRLARAARGPLYAYKMQQVQDKITILQQEQKQWRSVLESLQVAITEIQQRIELMKSKINKEQTWKQEIEDCIAKIQAMTQGMGDDNNDAPLVENIKVEEPLTTTKVTMPKLTKEPTGKAEDYTSGRPERFEDVYTMGEMLGEGAFGAVHLCVHKVTGVERAVKIIQKAWMSEWELDDVIKEFQMLTKLNDNPNVIRVYEFYDTDETFYMVQELATGGELFDELEKRGGKVPEKDVALLMKNILGCAQYLDQHRIVHRDLNLENVLLQEAGNYNTVKLIDFGLAAKCEKGEKLYEMVGKPRYVAPEVLGDDGYDLRYDIWSCGIVAATLLTGFFPFEADTDMEVYQQITDGAYIDYDHKEWDGISNQAKSFVKQLLMFKEDDRPTAEQALKHPWLVGNTDDSPPKAEVWIAPQQVTVSVYEKNPESDSAARILQRFFRDAASVLAWHREEMAYWEGEKEDIERRRKEELEDTKKFLELERQQLQMEFLHKAKAKSDKDASEVPLQRQTVKTLKEDYAKVRDQHNEFKKSIRKITHESKQLARDDALLAEAIKELQKKISIMMNEQGNWRQKLTILVEANKLMKEQIALVQRKAGNQANLRDLAARKIQRFFRETTPILQWYRDEMIYLQEEQRDIERRRQEELADTKRFIDLEKKRFHLQMQDEMKRSDGRKEESSKSNRHCHVQCQGLEKARSRLLQEKKQHYILTNSIRQLSHQNKLLAKGGPVVSHGTRHLQKKVDALKKAQVEREATLEAREESEEELLQQIGGIQKKRDKQQNKIKQLEACIARITSLIDSHLESNDPKLAGAIGKLKVKSEKTRKSRSSFGSDDTASTCSDTSISSRRGSDTIEEKNDGRKAKRKKERRPFSWQKHALKRMNSAPDLNRMDDSSDSDSDDDDNNAISITTSSHQKMTKDALRHSDTGPTSPAVVLSKEINNKKDEKKSERRKINKTGSSRRKTMQRMDSAPMLWTAHDGKKNRTKSIKHSSASVSDDGTKKDEQKSTKRNSEDGGASYSWGDHGNDDDEEESSNNGSSFVWGERFKEAMESAPLLSIIANDSMRDLEVKNGSNKNKTSQQEPFKRTGTALTLSPRKSVKQPVRKDEALRGSENDKSNFSWEEHSSKEDGLQRTGTAPAMSSPRQFRKSIKRDTKRQDAKGQAKMKSTDYQWQEHEDFMDSAPLLSLISDNSPKTVQDETAVDDADLNKSAPLLSLLSPKREKKNKDKADKKTEREFNESAPLLSLISPKRGKKAHKKTDKELNESAPLLSLISPKREKKVQNETASSEKELMQSAPLLSLISSSPMADNKVKSSLESTEKKSRRARVGRTESSSKRRVSKKNLSGDKMGRGVPRARSLNAEGAIAEKSKLAMRAVPRTKSLNADGMATSKSTVDSKSSKAEQKEKLSKRRSTKADSKTESGGAYSWRAHMKRMDSAPSLMDASSQADFDDEATESRDSKDRRQSMRRNLSTPSLGLKAKKRGKSKSREPK